MKFDKDYFGELFLSGDVDKLTCELAPYAAAGNLDARYFSCHYSNDPNETNDAFDKRRIAEIKSLAKEWHVPSLVDLAWAYRHGDDVLQDLEKFKLYMTAAAILGDLEAKQVIASFLETELEQTGLYENISAERT